MAPVVGCLCWSCDGFWPGENGEYQVGLCGPCCDDLTFAYQDHCQTDDEDKKDALLLVGYFFVHLHGTRDCQRLMARAYDGDNPFQITIKQNGSFGFTLQPSYAGNYTFRVNLHRRGNYFDVVYATSTGETLPAESSGLHWQAP